MTDLIHSLLPPPTQLLRAQEFIYRYITILLGDKYGSGPIQTL